MSINTSQMTSISISYISLSYAPKYVSVYHMLPNMYQYTYNSPIHIFLYTMNIFFIYTIEWKQIMISKYITNRISELHFTQSYLPPFLKKLSTLHKNLTDKNSIIKSVCNKFMKIIDHQLLVAKIDDSWKMIKFVKDIVMEIYESQSLDVWNIRVNIYLVHLRCYEVVERRGLADAKIDKEKQVFVKRVQLFLDKAQSCWVKEKIGENASGNIERLYMYVIKAHIHHSQFPLTDQYIRRAFTILKLQLTSLQQTLKGLQTISEQSPKKGQPSRQSYKIGSLKYLMEGKLFLLVNLCGLEFIYKTRIESSVDFKQIMSQLIGKYDQILYKMDCQCSKLAINKMVEYERIIYDIKEEAKGSKAAPNNASNASNVNNASNASNVNNASNASNVNNASNASNVNNANNASNASNVNNANNASNASNNANNANNASNASNSQDCVIDKRTTICPQKQNSALLLPILEKNKIIKSQLKSKGRSISLKYPKLTTQMGVGLQELRSIQNPPSSQPSTKAKQQEQLQKTAKIQFHPKRRALSLQAIPNIRILRLADNHRKEKLQSFNPFESQSFKDSKKTLKVDLKRKNSLCIAKKIQKLILV